MVMLLAGCQPDTGCRTEMEVTAGVTVEWVLVDTTGQGIRQLQWDSVTVQGIGCDSLLYDRAKGAKVLRLPLRVDASQTDYRLTWHEQTDILHIQHTNNRQYISMACGCAIFHVIDSVWADGVFIDSLSLLNSTVENYAQDNIYLHLTTQKTEKK